MGALKMKPFMRNNAGKYMFFSVLFAASILILFGLLMLISPNMTKLVADFNNSIKSVDDADARKIIVFDPATSTNTPLIFTSHCWNAFLFGTTKETEGVATNSYFTFGPSMLLISYLPIAIGTITILWFLIMRLILGIGWRPGGRNIKQIVNPIKWYSLYISTVWFSFFFIVIITFLALTSSSFVLFGKIFLIDSSKFAFAGVTPLLGPKVDDVDQSKTWLGTLDYSYTIYWILGTTFGGGYAQQVAFGVPSIVAILLPIIPAFVGMGFAFIGLITGIGSWKYVNVNVLAAIGDKEAVELLKRKTKDPKLLQKLENSLAKYKTKDTSVEENEEIAIAKTKAEETLDLSSDANKTVDVTTEAFNKKTDDQTTDNHDGNLKLRCESFFKNNLKMMEMSGNISNSLYRRFSTAYDALTSNRANDKLDDIKRGIEDYINFITEMDKKFVYLIKTMLDNKRTSFGAYAIDLDDLIPKYSDSVKNWNLYEAELAIEQIFAITAKNTELLAKVGYCIKFRLSNQYANIDNSVGGIERLDRARDEKNYDAYRQTCMKLIQLMSPNRKLINGLVQSIY